MNSSVQRHSLALAGLFLLTIYGCGGGGGGAATSAKPVAEPGPPAPVAAASLGALIFSSAGNRFVQSFTSSAAQNTPDASNNIRYVERRSNSTTSGATTVANWNKGGSPARQADLHFTGIAWENCGLNGENLASVRDAAGSSTSNYCNSLSTSSSKRTTSDVEGQTMASVLTTIRAADYANLSVGDNSASTLNALLGGTTFPAGSTVSVQDLTALTTAPAYYPGIGTFVPQYSAAVAEGRAAAMTIVLKLSASPISKAATPCLLILAQWAASVRRPLMLWATWQLCSSRYERCPLRRARFATCRVSRRITHKSWRDTVILFRHKNIRLPNSRAISG